MEHVARPPLPSLTRTLSDAGSNPDIYLASQSQRRRALLEQIGVGFAVLRVDVDESQHDGLPPSERVLRLARDKAQAGWQAPERTQDLPVLGADTLIDLSGEVYGKPRDREHALEMLERLSGQTHWVHTGVALHMQRRCEALLSSTRVTLRVITETERLAYWYSGEPLDKAGGYAIQGRGAVFVQAIQGSYSGVVGLPLCETARLLDRFGVGLFR